MIKVWILSHFFKRTSKFWVEACCS